MALMTSDLETKGEGMIEKKLLLEPTPTGREVRSVSNFTFVDLDIGK